MRPAYRNITRKIRHKFSPTNFVTKEERAQLMQSIFESQLGIVILMHPLERLEPVLASNVWNLYTSLEYTDPINGLQWAPNLDQDTKELLKKYGYIE